MNTYIEENLQSTDKKLQNKNHSRENLITLYLYHAVSPPR